MSEEKTFDPRWVVELFNDTLPSEFPQRDLVLANIAKCTKPIGYCSCGCGSPQFIDPKGPDWKFMTNLCAYRDHLEVILDVMEDHSIGFIELLDDMPYSLESFTRIEVE